MMMVVLLLFVIFTIVDIVVTYRMFRERERQVKGLYELLEAVLGLKDVLMDEKEMLKKSILRVGKKEPFEEVERESNDRE